MREDTFKDKFLAFWKEKAVPFLKTEHGFKTWVVLAIAFSSFIFGAWLF